MSDFASESGHWYLADGAPYYTLVGANGKERPVTLRDARKVGALPSVTTIIRMAAAPALERWKRNQLLLAALTLPRRDGEAEVEWLRRVEQDWQEEGRAAADKGSAIHAAIEQHFRGELPDEELWPWVKLAKDALSEHCGEGAWEPERSFAHPLGFGGKTDLHRRAAPWVVDVKTKDGDLADCRVYDEHAIQLAAYRYGLDLLRERARGGILFVSRTAPCVRFEEVPEADLVKGWAMFEALLHFWQAKNDHAPH